MVTVILCAVALAAVSGCGGGGDGTTSTPTTSTTPAASAGGQTYSSKAFVLPLTVTVDAALKSPPIADSHNLLSWYGATSDEKRVRFLVPVNLYRPGSTTPEAVPKNYLKYPGRSRNNRPANEAMLIRVPMIDDVSDPDRADELMRFSGGTAPQPPDKKKTG